MTCDSHIGITKLESHDTPSIIGTSRLRRIRDWSFRISLRVWIFQLGSLTRRKQFGIDCKYQRIGVHEYLERTKFLCGAIIGFEKIRLYDLRDTYYETGSFPRRLFP